MPRALDPPLTLLIRTGGSHETRILDPAVRVTANTITVPSVTGEPLSSASCPVMEVNVWYATVFGEHPSCDGASGGTCQRHVVYLNAINRDWQNRDLWFNGLPSG